MPRQKSHRSQLRVAIALVLLGASGCASHKGETRPGTSAPFGQGRNATVGVDRGTVPPGQTIPPAGLGVDLM